jgi:predicted GH43/DUF377 family glycosyl hydrolase
MFGKVENPEFYIAVDSAMVKLSKLIDYEEIVDFNKGGLRHSHFFNMSFCEYNGKIVMLFRDEVNERRHSVPQHTQGILNRLMYAELIDGRVQNIKEIEVDVVPDQHPFSIVGVEDPRVFVWKDDLYAICANPSKDMTRIEMVLVKIEKNKGYSTILKDPLDRPQNKNWMPFVQDDRLFLIIDSNPTRVVEFVDGEIVLVKDSDLKPSFDLCGGTMLFDDEDYKYAILHGKYKGINWTYWHTFARWDKDWNLKVTQPFNFEYRGLEFSSGAMIIGDRLQLSYSARDHGFKIIEFDKDKVKELF